MLDFGFSGQPRRMRCPTSSTMSVFALCVTNSLYPLTRETVFTGVVDDITSLACSETEPPGHRHAHRLYTTIPKEHILIQYQLKLRVEDNCMWDWDLQQCSSHSETAQLIIIMFLFFCGIILTVTCVNYIHMMLWGSDQQYPLMHAIIIFASIFNSWLGKSTLIKTSITSTSFKFINDTKRMKLDRAFKLSEEELSRWKEARKKRGGKTKN